MVSEQVVWPGFQRAIDPPTLSFQVFLLRLQPSIHLGASEPHIIGAQLGIRVSTYKHFLIPHFKVTVK